MAYRDFQIPTFDEITGSSSHQDLDMSTDTHLLATSNSEFVQDIGGVTHELGIRVQHVATLAGIRQLSIDNPYSCIITDCRLEDVWFDTAFSWFDDAARVRPLIIIFKSAEHALDYRKRANHAMDIFPAAAMYDERFRHVLPAALLRYDLIQDRERRGEMISFS